MTFNGQLMVASRKLVDAATLRGTWTGGPAVDDIKRTMVIEEA